MKGFCGEMVEVQPAPLSTAMDYSLPPQTVYEPTMVHPALIGMSSSYQEALSAGFSACADEAVRYLIEEEHFAPDDPIVEGLREHLRQKQQLYAIENIFKQFSALANDEGELNDSGVSFVNDQEATEEETDDVSMQECAKQSETKTTLNLAAISNIADELITLLEADDSFFEDDYSISEQ